MHQNTPRPASDRIRSRALLAAALAAAGCNTQRWPGPMEPEVRPLPAGDLAAYPSGSQEVIVLRHADPVELRPAGGTTTHPLSFYEKKERAFSGAVLSTRAGGRAEILWPGLSASFLMFDEGAVVIGEPSRDEPAVLLRQISSARVVLVPGIRVRLLGGGILAGDPDAERSGPFLLERIDAELVRLRNQSKQNALVDYRDEHLAIAPGQSIDLAILEAGADPIDEDPRLALAGKGVVSASLIGEVAADETTPGALSLAAGGEGEVRGLGQRIALQPGERVRFLALGQADLLGEPLPAVAAPAGAPDAAGVPQEPAPPAADASPPVLPVPPVPPESPGPPVPSGEPIPTPTPEPPPSEEPVPPEDPAPGEELPEKPPSTEPPPAADLGSSRA